LSIRSRLITVVLLGALVALVVAACSENVAETPDQSVASPTVISPAVDATATSLVSEPEPTLPSTETPVPQPTSAIELAATQIAGSGTRQPDATTTITPATQEPVPARAIATGRVDRIAFENGDGSIFTVDPDGSDLTVVGDGSLESGGHRYTFPVWSPDGGSVLFSSFLLVNNTEIQSALHRADADGNGVVVTLTIDPRSQRGVGPGVPHFSSWSPDGERIALTTSSEFGIGSVLLDSHSGERPKGIAIGAPLYINWAPDGSSILVHQDAGLHLIRVNGSASGMPIPVGTGSISFNSPSWAPDSKSFAHIESINGDSSVVITNVDELDDHKIIGDADTRVAVGWSPDGKQIAIARSSGVIFNTLSVYDVDAGEESIIHEGDVRAFWWSPDSSKLAIIEDSSDIYMAHTWSVIDVDSGDVIGLGTHIGSNLFLFVQSFFDQYVESHNIWSPDSSHIVISGAILDVENMLRSDIATELPDDLDSHIWVVDVSGENEPFSVARGTIASWSPQ
jgi:TolB protein